MVGSPKFDYTFNFGHVIQLVMMLFVVVGFGWRLIVWQENTNAIITNATTQLDKLQTAAVPLIQSNTVTNKLQDERIDSLRKSLDSVQLSNQQILTSVYSIREDVATIKAKQHDNERERNPH